MVAESASSNDSRPMRGCVWWSFQVQTSSIQKLRQVHLPPIANALENVEFEWEIVIEDESPGLFRVIMCQNIEFGDVGQVVISVLRRAYRLAQSWTISGLDDLAVGRLRHVMGGCGPLTPSNRTPALHSLMFEIEPGRVVGRGTEGGWKIVDRPLNLDRLKAGQTSWPDEFD